MLQKLIKSGHYRLVADGRVRSIHLAVPTPFRIDHSTYASPLVAGTARDIKAGSHTTYYFLMPFCQPIDVKGLADCVRIEKSKRPPLYVVDNHQLAHFAWEEALAMGYIRERATLVHIDAHADMESHGSWSLSHDLGEVADQVINQMSVGCFIMPAMYRRTINEVWFFQHQPNQSLSLEATTGKLWGDTAWVDRTIRNCRQHQSSRPNRTADFTGLLAGISDPQHLVLDIDLDAFVKGQFQYNNQQLPTRADFQAAARFLAGLARKAGVVTIATSPGYADQRVAIPLAQQLVREINS